MSLLSRLRCITVDVTGTLIAYKGELGDYYCMAAKSVGLPCPDYKRVHEGFKLCIHRDDKQAGYEYDEETFEKIFKRIYASFGSSAPYMVFPDSQPFLRWAHEKGLKVGIISNAEYRYQDVILPALGLNQGSEWDFGVFSGLEGVEKPDRRIYEIALERAGNIAPEETLHVGDSMRKDYVPARSLGMNALLLDRFSTPEAEEWRKSGAIVLPELTAVQELLCSENLTLAC
ncbi:20S proteasome alpha subunit C1 isoform 1 [Hibiscus syriacus]|uniref:20S proteasome alpha subunit C1 isoform 1 n=1 Tax=Hibiscus syriacus TaxID=106335 RepID=A0A6A2X1Y6_HIBSY|nr:20S proteasome alpha subunit C1 isoform 1 [Hibiscus syriacus]